jgi:hypothetical protein
LGSLPKPSCRAKIQNHEFEIRSSVPNVKVSWQITGVRQDAFAKAHPLVVEQEKDGQLKGFYIHPEFYGARSEPSGRTWSRDPRLGVIPGLHRH